MAAETFSLGIVGGSGMLGRAIARALLDGGAIRPENFWISNRSGSLSGFEDYSGLTVARDNQALADACDVVLLCVPPAHADTIDIDARDRLVLSVMAGVSIERITRLTGARRVVRAMSSPAAEFGLAYSPWVASRNVDEVDRQAVRDVFGSCGQTDEVPDESQMDIFTAMTGPVPGFVAFYAASMVRYATERGIAPEVADRAIRQLFLSAGRIMAEGAASPDTHVRQMIDYDGTTAAGLLAMRASPLAAAIGDGLDAAVERARTIG